MGQTDSRYQDAEHLDGVAKPAHMSTTDSLSDLSEKDAMELLELLSFHAEHESYRSIAMEKDHHPRPAMGAKQGSETTCSITSSITDVETTPLRVDRRSLLSATAGNFRKEFLLSGKSLSFSDYLQREEATGSADFYLKKRTPGRSKIHNGLDWQQDPRKGADYLLHPEKNRPLDYSIIRGQAIHHQGKKWLIAERVRHPSTDKWLKAPHGAALPFYYERKYVLKRLRPHRANQSCRNLGDFVEDSSMESGDQ